MMSLLSGTMEEETQGPLRLILGLFPVQCPIVKGCFPVLLLVPGPILFVLLLRENVISETTISNSSQYHCFSNLLLFRPSVTINGWLLEPLNSSNQPNLGYYSQIPPLEAKRRMENLKQDLKSLLQTHQAILTKQEKLDFNRSLETQHRLPVFYDLPKVHKNPVSLRPVISTCGSLLSIFSIWLDFKMKELLPLVKS
jgi:hypothetical protein